jgi:5-oxoprolinase (ATP-hydrolysing)
MLLRDGFTDRYLQIHGHAPPLEQKPLEVESMRVVAAARHADVSLGDAGATDSRASPPEREHQIHISGEWRSVAAHQRDGLRTESVIDGPAIILDRRSSYVIEEGWRARVDDAGAIVAQRVMALISSDARAQPEFVRLELFSHRFMAIATEMGVMLQRTALSTNVKERLDFSCTVLDADGNLIANAPHLPVHLGAMGVCVRAVRDEIDMRPGDVVITNHPAFGGSHLPDITIITPVFDDDAALIGYVANRAHHAELGGSRPGSMPPNARTLAEEGVVIAPTRIVDAGMPRWTDIERLLRDGRWPSRAPEDNLVDLRAQVAANNRGAGALQALAKQHGRPEVLNMMRSVSDRAAAFAMESLNRLPDNVLEACERLDDGATLSVKVDLTQRPIVIDFAGTAAQHSGNLNATPAIVRSAVIYVLRLLVGESLPLNEGLMRGVDVRIPLGSMLNPVFDVDDPAKCPAVVGGNTEVSQRLVDTLLKAFGIAACSQGTMNNVLFGDDRFGYYETVCGGSGATSAGRGADAVHVHMTNTRITDPEIIEHRYPVRLERFGIRRGSGGDGLHRGGDGAIRELTFLERVALSVLTQHRVESPYGSQGGRDGKCGQQHVIRASGERVGLRSVDGCDVLAGDRLILETPGGGGWGDPKTA